MIKIVVNHEMFAYDMYHITKAFLPDEKIEQQVESDAQMVVCMEVTGDLNGTFEIEKNEIAEIEDRKLKKRYVNLRLYKFLSELAQKELAWGILTGVRPTKLMMSLIEAGMSEEEVKGWMKENYCITDEKAELGIRVAKKEEEQLSQLDYENGYSLYIGIPFCPTTCSYCSFTSYPICQWKHRVDEYLDAVCKELSFIASVSKDKKLNTIYVGGGTPTTLEPNQLDRLLTHLEKEFSYADLKEITVEAGRPDSITREKLEVLHAHKIGRISINPQTMQQKTLDIIGRKHTVDDIRRVYKIAREIGFENINMDLIAGLPGESLDTFRKSFNETYRLHAPMLQLGFLKVLYGSPISKETENSCIFAILWYDR